MKTCTTILLALAGSATAFVIPDESMFEQLAASRAEPAERDTPKHSLLDRIHHTADHLLSSVGNFAEDVVDNIEQTFDNALNFFGPVDGAFNGLDALRDDFGFDVGDYLYDDDDDDDGGRPDRPPHPPGHPPHHPGRRPPPGDPNKTIYEQIKESNYTKKFAKAIENFPDIVELLKDTKTNHTLFVPTDRAIERLPGHGHHGPPGHDGSEHEDLSYWDNEGDDEDDDHKHKKPSKEFILAVLRYHLLPGLYPAGRVLISHTLPTELTLPDLGDRAQRLRVSVGLGGVRLNLYSRVVAINVRASNGIIHAVDHVLFPPPRVGRLIKSLPGQFSTLELALKNTGLDEELAKLAETSRGGTFFAPTNFAFNKLGPRLNAFLFSERGKKYLRALLTYHVVANETLYSDAYYARPGREDEDVGDDALPRGRYHVDLPSLLDGKTIGVDIRRWGGLIVLRVNGFVRVVFQDGVADDGVIQVVSNVLIPPRDKRDGGDDAGKDVTVEDLIETLQPYVEKEDVGEDENQFVIGDL